MMGKSLGTIVIIFTILTCAKGQTQEVVAAAGDSFVSDNYRLDWSLGELMVETYQSETNILTQGFHQRNIVSPITGVDDFPNELIPAVVFPNPTQADISISVPVELFSGGTLSYSLINLEGRRSVLEGTIAREVITLDLSGQTIGVYLLSIHRNSEIIKSFKVFKNN